MRIIDLLNKIANGEEVPEKIKIETHNFTRFDYSKGDGTFISSYQSDDGQYFIHDYSYPQYLNNEVEIIEEPQEHKIPEKFEIYDNSIEWCCNGRAITDNEKDIMDKINEIIDYLEELK